MNPARAARKIAGGRGKARLDKSGPSNRDTTGAKHGREIPWPRFDSTVSPLGALPRSRRHPDHGIKLVQRSKTEPTVVSIYGRLEKLGLANACQLKEIVDVVVQALEQTSNLPDQIVGPKPTKAVKNQFK
jgi:hypothetical protein